MEPTLLRNDHLPEQNDGTKVQERAVKRQGHEETLVDLNKRTVVGQKVGCEERGTLTKEKTDY